MFLILLCCCCALLSSDTFVSLMMQITYLSKITKQEFCLESIREMRRIRLRPAYLELLDCLVRSVVGRTAAESCRRVVTVYSDFNMEQFMAHAASGNSTSATIAGVASRAGEPENELGEHRQAV